MGDGDVTGEGLLWEGTCKCGNQVRYTDSELDATDDPGLTFGREAGIFTTPCKPCGNTIFVERTTVEVVPFSAWTILPPASGCAQCGRDHEPELAHDLQTMQYKYWFRHNEESAGREPRWPTWHDALRHCTPEVKARWIELLEERGVDVGPDPLEDTEDS